MITIDDFKKLEIRIGKVISAEKVPEADKLLKLVFDFGNEPRSKVLDSRTGEQNYRSENETIALERGERRQIIAGIAEAFSDPSVLVGKEMPVVVNPHTRFFISSNCLLLKRCFISIF